MLPNFVICLLWCLNFVLWIEARHFGNVKIADRKPPKIIKIGVDDLIDQNRKVQQKPQNPPSIDCWIIGGGCVEKSFIQNAANIDSEKIQISRPITKTALSINKNFNLDYNNRLALPLLGQRLTGSDLIGSNNKAKVQVGTNPNFSLDRIFDLFNLYQSRDTLRRTGVRDNLNFGTGYESNANVLYGITNLLNSFDANYNLRNGLDVNVQKGIKGLYTENDVTNVNPLALSFGKRKQICIAEFLFKGLCFQQQFGTLK